MVWFFSLNKTLIHRNDAFIHNLILSLIMHSFIILFFLYFHSYTTTKHLSYAFKGTLLPNADLGCVVNFLWAWEALLIKKKKKQLKHFSISSIPHESYDLHFCVSSFFFTLYDRYKIPILCNLQYDIISEFHLQANDKATYLNLHFTYPTLLLFNHKPCDSKVSPNNFSLPFTPQTIPLGLYHLQKA